MSVRARVKLPSEFIESACRRIDERFAWSSDRFYVRCETLSGVGPVVIVGLRKSGCRREFTLRLYRCQRPISFPTLTDWHTKGTFTYRDQSLQAMAELLEASPEMIFERVMRHSYAALEVAA